jgi:acyl-CoA thioesterase I
MTSGAGTAGQVSKRPPKRRRFAVLATAVAAVVTACTFAAGTAQEPGPRAGNSSGPMLVVIGDSYSEGVDNTVVWPQLLAEERGYRLVNLSIGGTGYVNGAFATTFVDRIKSADLERPSIIIFAGSRNDIVFSSAEVEAAAREALASAQDRFPDARIVAIGPIWDSSTPVDEVRAINSAVSQAADASGIEFVDALSADWLADRSLIHADGIHATDAGQQVLSDGVEEAIPDLP